VSDWQPIRTAPKDGTLVIGYWPSVTGYECDITTVSFIDGEWRNPDDYEDEWQSPAHWMPLPDPPAPTTKEGA